jgi:hypothetical protein
MLHPLAEQHKFESVAAEAVLKKSATWQLV